MILHQQILHPENAPRLPWLALHAESLTLALCKQRGHRIHITRIGPIGPIGPISNTVPTPAALDLISSDIRLHIPGATTRISSSSLAAPSSPLPPYLLLNSLDGTTPAILHTQDPVALYLAEESGSLAPAAFFHTSTDISAEGWAYWWEDAQRAFHKLTVEFMIECGMPVPPHIADAVKHD